MKALKYENESKLVDLSSYNKNYAKGLGYFNHISIRVRMYHLKAKLWSYKKHGYDCLWYHPMDCHAHLTERAPLLLTFYYL